MFLPLFSSVLTSVIICQRLYLSLMLCVPPVHPFLNHHTAYMLPPSIPPLPIWPFLPVHPPCLHYRNRCLCQEQDALGKGTFPLGGTSAQSDRQKALCRDPCNALSAKGVPRGQAGSRQRNFSKTKKPPQPPPVCRHHHPHH